MRRSSAFFLSILLLGTACRSTAPPPAAPPLPTGSATLYRRLGGYDALAAVVDDFLRRVLADPAVAPYFDSLDDAGKQRVRQMLVDQICAVSGGPCIYVGADMPTAHKGLDITEADWDKAVTHLVRTLDRLRVPNREQSELLSAISATKNDIVGK